MPIPLDIPAGFLRVDSDFAAGGRFLDGDKILFKGKRAEKWPGWIKYIQTPLLGKARSAVSWTNKYGNTNVGIGTNLKLYAITGGDRLIDITPIANTGTLSDDPFEAELGSSIVIVHHDDHGRSVGDFVSFEGVAAFGGLDLNDTFRVAAKLDPNSYTIDVGADADSDAVGGGDSVEFSYEINTGNSGSLGGLGWGAGTWGEGTWSTPRDTGIPLEMRVWSLNEYGNDLLAAPSGGTLYYWVEDMDARAHAVANAPASMRGMFVTPERQIIALGTQNPMMIESPHVDDMTNWTPAQGNTAFKRTLQNGSKLIAGAPLANRISVIWSDTALYALQYTGSAFVYDSPVVGEKCGLVGAGAFVTVSGVAYWMSDHDFHMYSGSVGFIPRRQEVSGFVFADIDKAQIAKTWCEYDESNNIVRWGYCSIDAPTTEPNKYVDVCLDTFDWTTGTLDRTTSTRFKPGSATRIMVGHEGHVYQHNVGVDADGQPLQWRLVYGLYAASNGAENVDITGFIPDFARHRGTIDVTIYTRDRPQSEAIFDQESFTLSPGDTLANPRVCGRHFGLILEGKSLGGDFRNGINMVETGFAGERR